MKSQKVYICCGDCGSTLNNISIMGGKKKDDIHFLRILCRKCRKEVTIQGFSITLLNTNNKCVSCKNKLTEDPGVDNDQNKNLHQVAIVLKQILRAANETDA